MSLNEFQKWNERWGPESILALGVGLALMGLANLIWDDGVSRKDMNSARLAVAAGGAIITIAVFMIKNRNQKR